MKKIKKRQNIAWFGINKGSVFVLEGEKKFKIDDKGSRTIDLWANRENIETDICEYNWIERKGLHDGSDTWHVITQDDLE